MPTAPAGMSPVPALDPLAENRNGIGGHPDHSSQQEIRQVQAGIGHCGTGARNPAREASVEGVSRARLFRSSQVALMAAVLGAKLQGVVARDLRVFTPHKIDHSLSQGIPGAIHYKVIGTIIQ
jgi:hypothetical protein